ncbi:MAG TPA: ABC transporter permease [Bryobacteraceae bacterium]|nr:ABC transporter permease [Bryobacteraceae bacterium]HOQ46558.1 ABC transporter permease [Bryobacteraceae bacterium]HPU73349.1 ABC transporter permease [Bryobacteraceae bacterium]
MSWAEILSAARMALATIREHKMRSFLTVLGVIIGTATVIAVGSIITGLDSSIVNIFRSFGPNTMLAFKFPIGFRFNVSREEMQRKPLTLENARAIAERCPSVQYVSPYLFPDFNTVHRGKYKGNEIYDLDLGGTEEAYAAGGTVMKYGRFLSQVDNLHRLPVAVIGEDLAKSWFPNIDPVGKFIEVDGHQFEVIGVMERPAASFPGQEDRRVLLPYNTMRKMFPNAKENMLVIIAQEGKLAAAMDEVYGVLRQERRLKMNEPDNFAITTAEQMVEDFRKMMSMTAIVMVVLSSIGLLVGGVGVMNIMLVSVTERTKEIGVRKAVGARSMDIIVQFLTEAVVLTGLGGLLGMSLGWLISLGAKLVFPSVPTTVPLWAAAMGVTVSVGVGLFFGIWPAAKAARLDPVEALRYE